MGYFRVDDILLSHWRAKVAGPAGIGIWTMGGLYCATNLTDGHIPHVVAATLLPAAAGAIKKALQSELWLPCGEHEKCYVMRAYHADSSGSERQPTRAEVERRRQAARDKKRGQRRDAGGRYTDATPPIEDGGTDPTVPSVSPGDTGGTPPSYSISTSSELLRSSSPSPADGSAEPPKERETRLPADWMPTAAHLATARERHLNLEHQAEQFRLHAETHDRRAARWNAAFTTWLKRADPTREPRVGRPDPDAWMNR